MRILLLSLLFCSLTFCALNQETLEKVFVQHQAQLKYTNVANQPFVVTFSGTPGMGKTIIAKKLEDSIQAVRISTDILREILHTTGNVSLQEYDDALQQYIKYFFQNYTSPNRRIVLDASVDRKYPQVFSFLQTYDIPYATIRLEVPRELVIERLKSREGARVAWYLKHLDAWMNDYQKFAEKNSNYILFRNVDNASYDALVQEINNKLTS